MNRRIAKLLPAAVAVCLLAGCGSNPTKPEEAEAELSKALKEAATRAVEVRVAMAQMQPAQEALVSGPTRNATSLIDIDYTGPVEKAVRIVGSSMGWNVRVRGKRRGDPIVSLRHDNVDSLIVLRDIGAQCADKCDVNVDLVEGGKSTVTIAYR